MRSSLLSTTTTAEMNLGSPFCALLSLILLCGYFVSSTDGASCREPPMNPELCCKLPTVERQEEIVGECVKTHIEQVKREREVKSTGPIRGCCIAECILNGTGHADLSAEKWIELDMKLADQMGTAAEWQPVIKSTAEICDSEAKKHEAEFEEGFNLPPVAPGDQVCHPKYVYSLLCSLMGNFQNCPSKYYTDSKDCNDLKEFYKTCDI